MSCVSSIRISATRLLRSDQRKRARLDPAAVRQGPESVPATGALSAEIDELRPLMQEALGDAAAGAAVAGAALTIEDAVQLEVSELRSAADDLPD